MKPLLLVLLTTISIGLHQPDPSLRAHALLNLNTLSWDLYSDVPPDYEQPLPILKRVQKFIARVRRSYFGRHVVAVTHGDLIAFSILWAKTYPGECRIQAGFSPPGTFRLLPGDRLHYHPGFSDRRSR